VKEMSDMAKRETLLQRRDRILADLPDLTEILRGSLRRRFVRCGKAGCHCQRGRGHGPVVYLSTSQEDGQTRQITITADAYALAKRYVENYQRARRVLDRVCSANRDLLQQRLLPPEPVSSSTAKRRRRNKSGT
jgi:hypothetical protein